MNGDRRGSRSAVLLLLILLVVVIPGALWLVGTYEPVKLAAIQEQVLSVIKGGASSPKEEVVLDGCVEVPAGEGQVTYRAIRRVKRTVRFADGSQLEIVYSEPPEPNPQCP